ncbi:hypothetical protein DBZ36_06485 [Alginatibacterium sediminis]|uniref:Cytochrome b562 n=1 Tax=Alginatibacterium sediminis TaxID=2164068 RepID=A0A420EH83_9ALTE|nr:cytochrome b562 [Alginatibacterium sediminis]RKF20091.1 hypothetical protein DBZ36_06485 [Alginatibacterium sediminis]
MLKTKMLLILCLSIFSNLAFAHSEHCGDTKLSEQMDTLKTELRAYSNAFKDGDKTAMLAHAQIMLDTAVLSKQETPLKLKQEPSNSVTIQDYQTGIDELTSLLDQLLLVDDQASVKQALAQLKKHSKQSHKAFRLDCDD